MIAIFIELLMNLALLVAMSVISSFIRRHWERGMLGSLLQGVLFGGAAVLAMLHPLVLAPGLIFDGRSVMLSVCALFFGFWAAAVATGITVTCRLIQGGMGALTGTLVILASILLGLLFHFRWIRRGRIPSGKTLLLLGVLVHVAMLLLMFTLPGGAGAGVISRIGIPVIVIYPLVTLLIGEMLAGHIASKQTLEKLRQTEETLSLFIRHSPIHVYIKEVTATESRVLQASDNFSDMIGISGQDMIGKTMGELFPAEFASKMSADDWSVVSQGQVLRLDENLNDRHYATIKFPVRIGERSLLAGYTIDITDRIRAEEMLAEKEVRLRTLVNSIPDLVWLMDEKGVYLLCNPMFERFFGAPEASIVGKTDYDFVSRELADGFRHNDRLAMEMGRPVRNEETIPFADDGHIAFVETTKTPMRDASGRLIGVLGIAHDISERKRLEEERRLLELQLLHAQRMESIGHLAGGVAHDMNNVLGAILGLASASLEVQPDGSPVRGVFETIVKASDRGGKMVRRLLGFTRQSLAEEKELNLNVVLGEEVGLLERTTLAKVRLEMDLASDLRPIRGDANALAHVFMNLCVNSVDAMPGGGTITLRTRNLESDWIEVQVEDSGQGMVKEVLEKAMDPFFTTKPQGQGTGLGLALVYSTVKAHKGQIEIQSEPGRGTRVILRFPARDVPAPDAGSESESLVLTQLRPMRVLLVDDDDLVRSSLQEMLSVIGHEVVIASSGEQALDIVQGGVRPDAVILDMNMPGLGGLGTLPPLRLLMPHVPVLLATGRADQSALDLIEAYPGVTLLQKPFGMNDLRKLLERIAAGFDS